MILAALAIVWIVVLGSYAKERLASRRRDTVSSFRSQLSTLQRTQPRYAPAPGGPARIRASIACETARCRRRNALVMVTALMGTSVAVAFVVPSAPTVMVAVVCTAAFVGFVGILAQRQRAIIERHTKVRELHSRRRAPRTVAQPPFVAASSRR